MSCQVTYGEKKSLYDTCHLCTLFRIDGIKAISGGNFRGIQVIRVCVIAVEVVYSLKTVVDKTPTPSAWTTPMDYPRLKWTTYAAEV